MDQRTDLGAGPKNHNRGCRIFDPDTHRRINNCKKNDELQLKNDAHEIEFHEMVCAALSIETGPWIHTDGSGPEVKVEAVEGVLRVA